MVGYGVIAFIEALAPILNLIGAELPVAAGVFTRVSLLILMLPAFGDAVMPMRIRVVVAITLTCLLLPNISMGIDELTIPYILSEAFIGFALGFSIRVFLFALNFTGAIIAQNLSLSQVFGFQTEGDSSSLISSTLTLSASTLFLVSDLDIATIARLIENFELLPLGSVSAMTPASAAEAATILASESFRLGLILCIPFAALNFAYYLILGFINRAMPQLMVTFVGLPAIILTGLVLLTVSITALLTVWLEKISDGLYL